MWRETNVFGIYLSPLAVYVPAALVLWLPLYLLLTRLRLERWVVNPAVAHIAAFLCVLAALVTWM